MKNFVFQTILLPMIVLFSISCSNGQVSSGNVNANKVGPRDSAAIVKKKIHILKDTTVTLRAGLGVQGSMYESIRFRFIPTGKQYAVVSSNLLLSGGDSILAFHPIDTGVGYLTVFNDERDTFAAVTVHIMVADDWGSIKKAINDKVASCDQNASKCLEYQDGIPETVLTGFYGILQNKQIPDFSCRDVNGRIIKSRDFTGSSSILFVYEYGCPACKEAIQQMDSVADHLARNGAVVYSLCKDYVELHKDSAFYSPYSAKSISNAPPSHIAKHWLKPPGIICGGTAMIAQQLMVMGYPHIYVIDGEGIVRFIHFGSSSKLGHLLNVQTRFLKNFSSRVAVEN